MKKKDILKAVEPKKKKNNAENKKESAKKKSKKKETKKIEKKMIEKEIKEEIKVENKEIIEEIEEELPLKKRLIKFFIKLAIILFIIIILIIVFYALTEYKPKEKEKVQISGEGYYSLNIGDPITVMTWNIGYAALGDNADFFMDNGEMVQTADRNRINQNIQGIRTKIDDIKPNILFLQEVDKYSKRASHVDEISSFKNHLNNYSIAFATNLKVVYLAYPLTDNIGNVHSGITTLSKYTMDSAERIQLPSSYIWPVSMVNFKRCILISYIPIKDSGKKLVLMNIHLDAYNDDKSKEKQIEKLYDIMKKEKEKGNYVIVGGDFNQTFSNIDISKYPIQKDVWKPGTINVTSLEEDWNFYMDNEVPSCRSLDKPYVDANKEIFQYYVIDGYILSKNIDVQAVKTQNYDFVNTDHNPVVMKVTLKKDE